MEPLILDTKYKIQDSVIEAVNPCKHCWITAILKPLILDTKYWLNYLLFLTPILEPVILYIKYSTDTKSHYDSGLRYKRRSFCSRIPVLEPLILHLILCFRTPVLEPTKHCMPRPEVTVPDIACMMTQCREMYWWKTLPEISWSERWGIKVLYKISNKFFTLFNYYCMSLTNGWSYTLDCQL